MELTGDLLSIGRFSHLSGRGAVEARRILVELDRLIDGEEKLVPEAKDLTKFELEIKDVPARRVAFVRERVQQDELKNVIPAAIDRVAHAIGMRHAGPPCCRTSDPDVDGYLDVETGWPVPDEVEPEPPVEVTMFGGSRALVLKHVGPMEELSRSYRLMMEAMEEHGLVVAGDPVEWFGRIAGGPGSEGLRDGHRVADRAGGEALLANGSRPDPSVGVVPSIGRSTSLAFLVALALVAAGCADGGSERLVVPEVTGDQAGYQRVLGAYDLLRQAGFVVEITRDFRLSSEWPLGQVAQQWPRGGVHARRGSTVELTVSEGRQWFAGSGVGLPPIRDWNRERPLPSLVGMRVSEAADWLERHELGWDARLPALPATNRRKLLDTYIVTAQSPGAGHQVGINYTVQLDARVTDGVQAAWKEPRVRVPYVAREDLFGAYKRLQARGLRVETDSRLTMSSYQSAGVVAGQQPPAGGTVPRRTIVTLRLARERLVVDRLTSPYESGHVRMRELVGKSLGAAAKWLAANNLYWELLDAPALPPTSRPDLLDAYVVSAQRPRPGTRLPQLTQSKFGKPAVAGALPIQLRAELRSD